MTPADFDYIRHFIRTEAGIVIEPGKEYLVESRLLTLARKEGLPSLDELIVRLRAHPKDDLSRKIVDTMTTSETSFFRDIHPFEALRTTILPELANRNAATRQISFWYGAASSGQEAFSVLMTIAEHFPELLGWNLQSLGTDLCQEALAQCKTGRFSQLEINRGLPAALLVKYFSRQGAEWEFCADLRSRVEFREMNLARDWPQMPLLDVVFLRNVLIYFDVETRKAILAKVRGVLRPGGFLLLGTAETTFELDDAFESVACGKAIFYRLKQA